MADLLTLYGVAGKQKRDALLDMAREANTPGWWHKYGDVLPSWFEAYLELEAAAALIRTYETQFLPGLLHTEDYARAVILLAHPSASTEEIERRVGLRMARQQLLTRPDAPRLWAVVDEAALRRPVGDTEVMRAQIKFLIEAAKPPNVMLQLIPHHASGHAAAGAAFTILRFPHQDLPDVVYIEQVTSALCLDKQDDVDRYAAAMNLLCVEAESPARTAEILDRTLRDLKAPGA